MMRMRKIRPRPLRGKLTLIFNKETFCKSIRFIFRYDRFKNSVSGVDETSEVALASEDAAAAKTDISTDATTVIPSTTVSKAN